MKDLTKVIALLTLCSMQMFATAYAQVSLNAYAGQSYYPVSSYLGLEGNEKSNTFQFNISGEKVNIPNWSFSVRLVSPVLLMSGGPSKSGAVFPINKISFRWTVDNALPNMNLQSFGANRNEIILQEGNEIMLIERARSPLYTSSSNYVQLLLHSTLKIAAGKYLENYQSKVNEWTFIEYKVPLIYTLYDENKRVLSSGQLDYYVQINPKLTNGDQVDVEPEYSLVIGPEASNAKLHFKSTKDYVEGVSILIDNAVKVNAKTNFEIRVKSLDADLARNGGGSLPLSVLSTKLTAGLGAKPLLSNPELTLLTSEQVLLSGTSKDQKDAQYFNLNYKAKLTPTQLGAVKPGNYSLSILYMLLPK